MYACDSGDRERIDPDRSERIAEYVTVLERIKQRFTSLQTETLSSLEQSGITANDIATYLFHLGAGNHNKLVLAGQQSLHQVFMLLSNFWHIYDYDLLTNIIRTFGTAEDAVRMEEYIVVLQQHETASGNSFMLWSLSQTSTTGNLEHREKFPLEITELRVHVRSYVDPTLQTLSQIKTGICRVVHVHPALAVIKCIGTESGATSLTYHVLLDSNMIHVQPKDIQCRYEANDSDRGGPGTFGKGAHAELEVPLAIATC